MVTLAGGWPITGAFTPAAQADEEDGKDKFRFDHFACYEVKVDRDDDDHHGKKDGKDDEEVQLFNQFEFGTKVEVGRLRLLCVPTHKVHKKDDHQK